MSGEIKPIFSKEAVKQLELIERQMLDVLKVVDLLSNQQVNFKAAKDYQKSIEETTKAKEKLTAEEKKLQAATERLKFAQSDSAKELSRLNEETLAQNKINKQAAKDVLKLESEYEKFKKQVIQSQREAKELGVTLGKTSPEFIKAAKAADTLKRELREIDQATGDTSSTVGLYSEEIQRAFASLVPGFDKLKGFLAGVVNGNNDIAASSGGAVSAFANMKSGVAGLTKSALAFIATPIGAAIAALAVITGATVAFFEFNSQVAETNRLVEQLANTSGKATDKLSEQATAIEKAYGKEFKDAVNEIVSLQQDFGISAEEAFKIYNNGLAQGGAANAEFGDSIKEYGVLFNKSGFSAQEFVDLLNRGIDLGVYSDKLPDAIKEAGISLEEQTKATREALINAFGASFSEDLLARVDSGKTTVKDALIEIADQAQISNLSQEQFATLTADVFRGAGE
ncbi:MAG: phage tail tape measure protein, partial [Candidatus Paceibacterota bacterium]